MAKPIANAGVSPAPVPFSALPVASVPLSFTGTPGTGGAAITHARSWLLSKPSGSAAAIANTAALSTALNGVDSEGSYLVFVQVADNRFNAALPDPWDAPANANYVSEVDPLKAPTSAFWTYTALTQYLGAVIPATYERNWGGKYADFVGTVDDFKHEFDTQTIADHDTVATGAQLDRLVSGGNCDDLHTHAAGSIAVLPASLSVLGVVQTAADPVDVDFPRAHNVMTVALNGSIVGAYVNPGLPFGVVRVPGGSNNPFRIKSVTFYSSGPSTSGIGSVDVFACNDLQYRAGSWGAAIATFTVSKDSGKLGGLGIYDFATPFPVSKRWNIILMKGGDFLVNYEDLCWFTIELEWAV